MKYRTGILLTLFLTANLILSAQSSDSMRTQMKVRNDGIKNDLAPVSDTTIIVPNAFTPNGDSYNNEFKITSSGKYFLSFKVFTRAGIMVYKTLAKTIEWDGRMTSGEKLQPGIYFYVIEMTESAPPVKKSGFFYIFE